MIHQLEVAKNVWEPDERGVLRKNTNKVKSYWVENISDLEVSNQNGKKEGTDEHYQEFKKRCAPCFTEDDVRTLYAKIFRRQTTRYTNDSRTYPLGRNGESKRLMQ